MLMIVDVFFFDFFVYVEVEYQGMVLCYKMGSVSFVCVDVGLLWGLEVVVVYVVVVNWKDLVVDFCVFVFDGMCVVGEFICVYVIGCV